MKKKTKPTFKDIRGSKLQTNPTFRNDLATAEEMRDEMMDRLDRAFDDFRKTLSDKMLTLAYWSLSTGRARATASGTKRAKK
jgi:hypothetical protein